jgi:P-type E1-E2 ATPase
LVLLLAAGEFLERTTERQSNQLLRRLLRPDPAKAWVKRHGELIQVPGDEVRVDEIVVVGVGERIPVDGRVVSGAALVNQAAIIGEDVPVRKEAPRWVISGSVITKGRIRIQATQVGVETTTALAFRFIQESLSKRSHMQRLADELADKRVYLTLVTGGLVYALTRDLTRLESVFLVDYSCALKLGTPVAFKSGMYRAATQGILMKGGAAIEHLAGVDTISIR